MPLSSSLFGSWIMIDFAKQLVRLRKARGLTQQDLADLLDVQPRLVGRWEQGQGKPQFDYLLKLADVLEVSLDQLLRGEGVMLAAPDIRNRKLKELCRRVDQLKSEDQDVICHFLDLAVRHDQLRQLIERPLP